MKNTIHIGCAADDRYYPGLAGTLISILISSDMNRQYHFHLIYEGIESTKRQKLERILKNINPNSNVSWYDPDMAVFSSFPEFFFDSKLTYARLLFQNMVDADRLIYIDSDILVQRDLSTLWELELSTKMAAAAPDLSVGSISNDCPHWMKYGFNKDAAAFNGGLMLIDLKQFRKHEISETALMHLQKKPEECLLHDQSALNFALHGNFLQIGSEWNFMVNHMNILNDIDSIEQYGLNIHFVTSDKPWLKFNDDLPSNLFCDLLDKFDIHYKTDDYKRSRKKHKIFKKYINFLPLYYSARKSLCKLRNDIDGALMFENLKASYQPHLKKQIEEQEMLKEQILHIRETWGNKMDSVSC